MILLTNRCRLITPQKDTIADIARLFTNATVRRYLGGPLSVRGAHDRVSALLSEMITCWAIRTDADDAFIGFVSLGQHHDGVEIELSYLLLPTYWGQGYATEAVEAVLHYGHNVMGLPRIVAETQSANLASCRLLERVGMQFVRSVKRFNAEQSIYST